MTLSKKINILINHSIQTKAENGRVYCLGLWTQYHDDGTKENIDIWEDCTDWNMKQLKDWLGY